MQQTIPEVKLPRSVAVSKSGDIVVCHELGRCISVFNKKGEKILSFCSSGEYPYVAITADDNHILAISNHQIAKYTMEGRCVTPVECRFHRPSDITVHPSGKVIVTGSCIQVLNPDLSHSHSFGVCNHGVKGLYVACDSDGVVYVADNAGIRSFNIDGHCISKYSYDFALGAYISGICRDSTNMLYVSVQQL